MRVKLIENLSDRAVDVKMADGDSVIVEPGGVVCNRDVTNIDEIKNHTRVVYDLTEVRDG